MDRARTRFNFIILDACRDNPFAASFKLSSAGLAQMSTPSGTLIAYATSPGSVAADGWCGSASRPAFARGDGGAVTCPP